MQAAAAAAAAEQERAEVLTWWLHGQHLVCRTEIRHCSLWVADAASAFSRGRCADWPPRLLSLCSRRPLVLNRNHAGTQRCLSFAASSGTTTHRDCRPRPLGGRMRRQPLTAATPPRPRARRRRRRMETGGALRRSRRARCTTSSTSASARRRARCIRRGTAEPTRSRRRQPKPQVTQPCTGDAACCQIPVCPGAMLDTDLVQAQRARRTRLAECNHGQACGM